MSHSFLLILAHFILLVELVNFNYSVCNSPIVLCAKTHQLRWWWCRVYAADDSRFSQGCGEYLSFLALSRLRSSLRLI